MDYVASALVSDSVSEMHRMVLVFSPLKIGSELHRMV